MDKENCMIKENPWFIVIKQSEKTRCFLICCHYGGGSASAFRGWEEYFPEEIGLLAIQLPGRESRFSELPLSSLPLIIEQLLLAAVPFIEMPYVLFGHSIGGLVCFELARALRKHSLALPA